MPGNTHARYGAEGESVFAEIGSTWPVVGWSLANTSGSDFITRNLSEQQSSLGYRTRSVSGDRESCLPLTGALQDCLNVQKAFQSGGARLPNQTIMSKTFPRGQPKSISEKEVVLEKITKATILRSLRFQLMVEDALCFGTYNFKQLYIIILYK